MSNSGDISSILKIGLIAGIAYYVAGPVGFAAVALVILLKKGLH